MLPGRAARRTRVGGADELTEAKGCLAEDRMAKRTASKRELIDTGRNKMFASAEPTGRSRKWTIWDGR